MQKLKEELDKRKSNGETNLIIKYVRGIPKIIQLSEDKPPENEQKSKN